jgi:hypothetical protein
MILGDLRVWLLYQLQRNARLEGYEAFVVIRAEEETGGFP